ncbi:hypothetical protein [Sporomusa acidovorans]|uniref:Uncharacterized protein n=1 Tax=Sporomusa acidovorans (strain ATCC 49682 / DSM 3132 / Mol) TaxID=1123286 RepID=A0ABZ3J6N7_SPOA4|nr:hypothetical protein [Sporomusa acidovorans]OZC23817.1 hypothetical protein SPACI_04420 [Sporomusa acidovorans DSM 3132]SDF62117.1 hypothetical protein SAMN04488499_106322 [Sporomusa acidovorans]
MKFKVIAGVDKEFKLKSNKKDGLYLERSAGFLQSQKLVLTGNVAAFEQLTEESKSSFLKKAGWGTIGGIAFGPVGIAAGLWLTGKGKEISVACELKTGEKFVASVDNDTYKELLALSYC